MPKPLDELRERLLRAGVAPRHVRRYVAELSDHLSDLVAEGERAGRSQDDAQSQALARLGAIDDLSRAMTEQRQFQSWCARAPWAMFGVAPLILLFGAYFVACLVLWSGWKIFLPGAETPFVRLDGPAIYYFGIGKMIYFFAPVLVGWCIGLVAVRQRLNAAWPAVGLLLVAMAGGAAQVHVSRPSDPGGAGHVSMDFSLGPFAQGVSHGLSHALVILLATVLPWLVWRLLRARSLPA
jgi:hypothetical protein